MLGLYYCIIVCSLAGVCMKLLFGLELGSCMTKSIYRRISGCGSWMFILENPNGCGGVCVHGS